MLKRIWRAFLALFRRRGQDRHDSTIVAVSDAEQAPLESDDGYVPEEDGIGASQTVSPEMRRLALLTSGLKPCRPGAPQVRRMEVGGFSEAYRFWVRLCGQSGFSSVCSGGRIRCVSHINGQAGTLEFADKTSCCRDKVAVIRINAPVPEGQAKEIVFMVSNKKRIENENNQVRVHRKRSFPA